MYKILILIGMVLCLPLLYWSIFQWYKSDFDKEENQKRQLLRTKKEMIILFLAEGALVKKWFDFYHNKEALILFILLYTVLVFMTILCMADYWERIVPNKILLLMTFVCFIEIGAYGVSDFNGLLRLFPSMILGLLFCGICFGISYIISKGSLGAGDVKLAILLGLFLTSEYAVGTIFYGSVLSAIYSIVQMVRKKLTRKDAIPFVPFLYLGLIIIYIVG